MWLETFNGLIECTHSKGRAYLTRRALHAFHPNGRAPTSLAMPADPMGVVCVVPSLRTPEQDRDAPLVRW